MKIVKKQKNHGFTLIELIFTIALMVILGTAVALFATDIFKTKAKSIAVTEVQQNARFAMNKISYYIRNSENGINAGSSSFSPSDPGTLYLNMGTGPGDDIEFSIVSGRLQMTVGGGSPEFITTDEVQITSMIFTNNSSGSDVNNIGIAMDMQYDNQSSRQEFNYSYSIQNSVSTRQ